MFTITQRNKVIKYGRKLIDHNLTSGTGGNISIFDSESKTILITPSGYDFYEMEVEDLVIINLDGSILDSKKGRKPSSEWLLHAIFYQHRTDITTIIHAHTIYATVLSCLREPLPPTHYMVAVAGEDVRVADYATFGSKQLAKNAYEGMKDRKAVLLSNHGMVAGDSTLDKTFNIIEEVEYCSKIYCLSKSIGQPIILDDKEMQIIKKKFTTYGKNAKV